VSSDGDRTPHAEGRPWLRDEQQCPERRHSRARYDKAIRTREVSQPRQGRATRIRPQAPDQTKSDISVSGEISPNTKDKNGLEFGPPDQVLYEGHFEFTLKDADGFVLLKMGGPVEHLSAGAENQVQGTTDDTIPQSVIERAKEVDVGFLVTACNPCEPR
jgi:hypothetical protein